MNSTNANKPQPSTTQTPAQSPPRTSTTTPTGPAALTTAPQASSSPHNQQQQPTPQQEQAPTQPQQQRQHQEAPTQTSSQPQQQLSPLKSQQQAVAVSSAPAAPSSQAPTYHFKVLVPAAAAGRIIGKGGNAIVQLQKDAGARIKLSKASEFYPGTTERVCLISGPIEGILKIIESIVKSLTPDHLSRPNISSSPPSNTHSTSVTNNINNTNNNNSNSSTNSFGQLLSSSPSTSSPALVGVGTGAAHHLNRPSSSLTPPGCGPSNSLTPVGRPLSPAPSVTSDMNSAQIIETIKLVLRVSGYGEDAVSEISSGMSTLASYGVLGVGLGLL